MGFVAVLAVTGAVLVLAALLVIFIYNRLVALKARFENAFSQINVQLTRRYDLIPNIVEVAKGYMKHESETLANVIAARNNALASLKSAALRPGDPAVIATLNEAEKTLAGRVGGLNVQLEAYPELKANGVMLQLGQELADSENKVALARQVFNDAVTAYNVQRNTFPSNMVAPFFGHTQDAALLTFDNQAEIEQAPKIKF